jgi:KDO2-lipid IV(A) lauroyltransferase
VSELQVDPQRVAGRPAGAGYRARDALVGLVLPPVIWLLRHAPRPLFRPVVRLLAMLYGLIQRRDQAILHANLERVLGFPRGSRELRQMARRVTRNQIAQLLEAVRGSFDPRSVDIAGREHLDEVVLRLLHAGRGFIIVSGHLGSWELMAWASARACPERFNFLAKRSRVGPITELMLELRGSAGANVLWIDSSSLLREMLQVLRRGDGLGFAMDQKPRAYQGPVVDFFGYPTEFPAGPAALAERTGCAVIAAFCVRTGPFRYRVLVEELLPPDHGRAGEGELTQLFVHAIERRIRQFPDQWTWSYRRWLFERRRVYRPGRASRR